MSKIDDLLASEAEEPESSDVQVKVRDVLVTLRFRRMLGTDWAEIAAQNPMRPGVLVDMNYGYNLHAVVKTAIAGTTDIPSSGRVVEDAEVELTVEQWSALLKSLSGHDFEQTVTNAVWTLNEWGPAQEVELLKKASTVVRKKKPN